MNRKLVKLAALFVVILILVSCTKISKVEQPTETTENSSLWTQTEYVTEPETTAEETELPFEYVLGDIEADSIQYYECAAQYDFCVIKRDGKYGLIDYTGTIVLPMEYENIYPVKAWETNGLFASDSEGNIYSIDAQGQLTADYGVPGGDVRPKAYWYSGELVLFEPWTGLMSLDEFYYESGLLTAGMVIDGCAWNSEKVFPLQRLSGLTNYNDLYYEVKLASTMYGLMDMETNELLSDFIYEDIDDINGFQEGLFAVKKDGKWGFVDEAGNVVIDFLYDTVCSVVNGYIAVAQNGTWGMIDTQGNPIVDIAYDGISQANQAGFFWAKQNGIWTLYELNSIA